MSENTPQRIGDYEIIRELGRGGMGKVYQVRNVLTGRVEAMKLLLPDLADRSEFVARFMREIKTLAGLEHPNIAALRTAFSSGDQFAMIMEYVEGVTLADRLEQGRFTTDEALNYTGQVLEALSYAHGQHVIHRDVKPGNMMLTPQGVVKLMDFGLARSADEIGLTMTGMTLGSLDYSSPEQVQAQPTDERSDLYSVGVSLYQMVTGQRMFSATSNFSIMQAQVKEIPRQPMEVVATIPKALNDIIMMSIAKDPGQRFQSADAFRNALLQVAGASAAQAAAGQGATIGGEAIPIAAQPAFDPGFVPRSSEPASRVNRSLLIVVGVVLVAALLAGDAVYKAHRQRQVEQSVETPAPPPNPPASAGTSADNTTVQNQSAPATMAAAPAEAGAAASPQPPTAHKPRVQAAIPDMAPGPSAAEIEAEQQAAMEQKKLLDAMETEVDQLDGRAASVESSLDALEQQMHQSGMGLRGDMVAARANLRTDLAKAKQATDSSDTERARHYLDLAHREVEKLETFLGRR